MFSRIDCRISPVAPSDSSSQDSGGTFFADSLLEGAPGINVLTTALPEEAAGDDPKQEEASDLNPQGVAVLESVQPAENEPDSHHALVRFREILLDKGREASEKIHALLELGAERFGVENGHLTRIDTDEGVHKVVQFEEASPQLSSPSRPICRTHTAGSSSRTSKAWR